MATMREIQSQLFDRVNPAIAFSVRRYVLAIGFFVAVVVFGLYSTVSLGVDLMPTVNIPIVAVFTNYPGATPAVVDQQVTQVIEGAVSTLSGITDINSSSSAGFSRIILQLDPSSNKDIAMSQVSARVNSLVSKQLPTGIQAPIVRTFDPNAAPILQFGVTSQGISMQAVGDWVTNGLSPLLERVPGVANVTIDGAPARQFQVLLDPNKLRINNINPQDVSNAVAASALNQPIGSITTNSNTLNFSTQNLPDGVNSIARILVNSSRGIAVGDVAQVRDISVPANFDRVNGQPAILVSIQMEANGNEVAVAKAVREFLAKTQLPQGYGIIISNDTTGPISASINSTFHELFLTALVVALICLLFLGKLNTTLSVILAIPIALSAAPVLYALMGFTFNLVSLLAMIVAIGIVVDDSIVVSENVERYRALGYSKAESVLKGASEVFSAVVAASLSLLSVLLPVSFLGGLIGVYIQQFALGLAAAVFFSLIEAILFLTVRLVYTPDTRTFDWHDFFESFVMLRQAMAWGLKVFRKPIGIIVLAAGVLLVVVTKHWLVLPFFLVYPWVLGFLYYVGRLVLTFLQALTMSLHHMTEAGMNWLREGYIKGLEPVLKNARWVLVGMAVFFVATVVLIGPHIPFNFVPQSDSGTIRINLRVPHGVPQSIVNNTSGEIEAFLFRQPEVKTVQTTISTGGSITVQLVPVEQRDSSFILATKWRNELTPLIQKLPSARFSVNAGGFGSYSSGSTVSFNLTSSNFAQLDTANQAAIDSLLKNPWVTDVDSSLSKVSLENDFYPDTDKLKGTGLNPSTLASALQVYATGVNPANVQIASENYPIQVQMDPDNLVGTQSLENLPIYSAAANTTYTVGQLGRFVLTPAPSELDRSDRVYSAQLDISLKTGAPTPLAFQKEITKELTDAGILNGLVGLEAASKFGPSVLAGQLATQGPIAFLLAFFLAYLVMGAQFNSWRYPAYLLLPVPLAIVGALWFVFISGAGLDIFGVLGMLMLIGLSAKNAIIYLDFVVERIEVMPLKDALIDAARLRFRPIVMTTLTVLVISFPLIFNGGQGSEFGQKMGLVMLGGVFSSAVLTFFVVPAAFWLFERRRHQEKALGIEGPSEVEVLSGKEAVHSPKI